MQRSTSSKRKRRAGHRFLPSIAQVEHNAAGRHSGGIPVKPRRDRDEYPGAMFKEGGAKASVEHTGIYDNRGSGRCMRAQCADVPDGSQIQITIRP